MILREQNSRLHFTKVNGFIVPLESFKKPSLFDGLVHALAVIIFIAVVVFIWIALPKGMTP